MTEAKAALLQKLALSAQQTIDNWPQWKKDESDREDQRFQEMGSVARYQR
jgi:hypothetical protein